MAMRLKQLKFELGPGDSIRAEAGSLLYMTPGIEMQTSTGGGLSKGITRVLTGESFFVCDFKYNGNETGRVAFAPSHPSKIIPLRLSEHDGHLICQKGAFLCGASNTEIDTYLTKNLTTGFFGGEGFILQRLTGDGLVLIKGGGSLIKKTLADGEELLVSSGSLVAFEVSVDYDVQMLTGAKNIIFGGEGLFLSRLRGPGDVWIQGLPFSRLVESIAYSARGSGEGSGSALLGGMIGGAMMGGHGGHGGGSATPPAADTTSTTGADTRAKGEEEEKEGEGREDTWKFDDEEKGAEGDEDGGGGGGGWFSSWFGGGDD